MGMSIYTAAVVWCLIGQPQTFMSCEVMNAKQKFATEEGNMYSHFKDGVMTPFVYGDRNEPGFI